MATDRALHCFIGYDSREAVCSDVAAHSILKRTKSPVSINYLKHRELRKAGLFVRPWQVDATTGNWRDQIDGKPFSTEFSHTRFLVPKLMEYRGWALFFDADMIFLSDIEKLFALRDESKAVMVVKHQQHVVKEYTKMDGREQLRYHRKNWSSFILWNCGHPLNRQITPEKVSFMPGLDLHTFSWLPDSAIGELPFGYNYISGVSPKLPAEAGNRPDVIHYTDGGPWFESCRDVPFSQFWMNEYSDWQNTGGNYAISEVPSMKHEDELMRRR